MACKVYDTAQNYLCQTLPVSLVHSTRNHVKILSITVRASLPPSLVFLSWVHRANANMKLLCYFNICSSAGEWDSWKYFPEKQKSPEIKKPHLEVYLLGSRPNKVEDAKTRKQTSSRRWLLEPRPDINNLSCFHRWAAKTRKNASTKKRVEEEHKTNVCARRE